MNKNRRIIIDGEVLTAKHSSGIGHYTLELLKKIDDIADSNSNLKFFITVYFRNIKIIKSYGFNNIKILPMPFPVRLVNKLKRHNLLPPIDIIYGKAVYIFPNFTSWPLIRKSSKAITFVYDISFERFPQFADPRNQKFLSVEVNKSVKRSDTIATISKFCKKEISDFYNIRNNKIKIYYPSVNQNSFYRRSDSEIESIKRKYDIKGDYILFVGNLEPRKNLKNLLLAYEKTSIDIKKKYSLLLVGARGWQDSEIFETISRLKGESYKIIFPSKYVVDDDLPAIYSGASVFVYPSVYEGFGIPPIEAMACGVPVICANNSSLPEAVDDAAILVNSISIDEISNAITNTLQGGRPNKSLIEYGYKQVDKFSWRESALKLIKDIESL